MKYFYRFFCLITDLSQVCFLTLARYAPSTTWLSNRLSSVKSSSKVCNYLIKWLFNNLSNSCGWISIKCRRCSDVILWYFKDDEINDHLPIIFVNVKRNDTTRLPINLKTFWQKSLNINKDVLFSPIWMCHI